MYRIGKVDIVHTHICMYIYTNVNGYALCFSNKEKTYSGKMTMTIMQRGNFHVVTEQMTSSGYQTHF